MSEPAVLEPRLTVSGATCQGCVRKIRAALVPLTGDEGLVQVDLEHKTIALPEGIDSAEAAKRVTEAGYPAEPIPEAPAGHHHADHGEGHAAFTKSGVPTSEDLASEVEKPTDADSAVTLSVSGATCASCVNTIEKAMRSVPGVTHAHMNLADNTASATGARDSQALVRAIESAGYGAKVIEDEDAAAERRDAEDKAQYRSLMVKMSVSLGLGIALMVWGMGFGSMMVGPENQLTWINLGILTLGVMV
ncbi:MAG: Cu+ exporting ATPase, partial [Marinobacter sp. 34-60-7]